MDPFRRAFDFVEQAFNDANAKEGIHSQPNRLATSQGKQGNQAKQGRRACFYVSGCYPAKLA
jgi:hypothetical protein